MKTKHAKKLKRKYSCPKIKTIKLRQKTELLLQCSGKKCLDVEFDD